MKNHHSSHGNKIASRLLKSFAIACAAMSLLAACGQRGSLYLPTAPEAAQRSTIVDTLTKPAPSVQPASDTNPAPAK
jgi:predicted small lipoprotein YifL